MASAPELLHATAIAAGGAAALIRGPSGAGKSDLALRCLALPPGPLTPETALLVADDQVLMSATDGTVWLEAPATIAGLIEVRGIGILPVPHARRAALALVVDLVAPADVPRLPDPPASVTVAGRLFPLIRLAPFESSAPLKLMLALAALRAGQMPA